MILFIIEHFGSLTVAAILTGGLVGYLARHWPRWRGMKEAVRIWIAVTGLCLNLNIAKWTLHLYGAAVANWARAEVGRLQSGKTELMALRLVREFGVVEWFAVYATSMFLVGFLLFATDWPSAVRWFLNPKGAVAAAEAQSDTRKEPGAL